MNLRASFTVLLLAGISLCVKGQKIEWATGIVAVSSKNIPALPGAYAPVEALGPPSAATYGSPLATGWSPATQKTTTEFIHVSFKMPTNVKQIVINEIQNSGSITTIWLYDAAGAEYEVYQNAEPKPVPDGLFIHVIPQTAYKAVSLKVEFNTRLVPGFIIIDAIGISPDDKPFERRVNEFPADLFTEDAVRLGDEVNSATAELLPVISPDGGTLFFTRQNHPGNIGNIANQDVWQSDIDKNTFTLSLAVNVGAPVNNTHHNSLCSITPDGQTALVLNVYKPDGSIGKGISITTKGSQGWSVPREVLIDSFYNKSNYGEYSLNADNRTMVMTLQRDDAVSGKDVYVSFLKDDSTWTVPKNLGRGINTADGESSPYLAPDRKTLYFSSSGWPGYGGRDMFVSTRLDDTWTNWSTPINLGPKINNPGFNAYFVVPASGEYAFFTSNLGTGTAEDLFRIKLPKELRPKPVVLVKGKVYNAKTKQPVGAAILYESYTTKTSIGTAKSDENLGDYQIVLPAGSRYGFLATAKGFASLSENIDLQKLSTYTEITQDLFLYPLEKGQVIRLNNVFFDTDKYVFRSETSLELNRLVKMLEEYPALKIEVSGHTDSSGDVAHNQQLSTNRAKAVYDYLLKNKIESDRISFKGYGKSKPVAANTTEAGRQQNRRVEFLILEN